MIGRALVFVAVVAALLALPPFAAAAKPAPAPDRVQVQGTEFDLLLSKRKLVPGRAIVQFVNAGEDAHNLILQRLNRGGAQVDNQFAAGEVEPGDYTNIDARLKKGSRYVLWCSLQDHRQRGMEATLRTRRHRAR